ncbi:MULTISPECIES: hypothetical protein [Pseudomonas]|uniref:hypothetical protein n=1 Tax=Pseudomonas TaxID=286 RepID=UPI00211987B4|nr:MULTISPECIES: hypothetical protein [Pseudomonas]
MRHTKMHQTRHIKKGIHWLSLIGAIVGAQCIAGMAFAGSGNATEARGEPSNSTNANVEGAYQSATQALQGIIENMDQEDAERTQNELRDAAERDRQAMIQKADEDRKNRESLRKASEDKSLNPWANKKPAQSTPQKLQQASHSKANPQPLDPDVNYDGQPCKYFTKHNDDSHLYYHQEGAMVSYGNRVYQCTGSRWRLKVFADKFWADPKAISAEKTEN